MYSYIQYQSHQKPLKSVFLNSWSKVLVASKYDFGTLASPIDYLLINGGAIDFVLSGFVSLKFIDCVFLSIWSFL